MIIFLIISFTLLIATSLTPEEWNDVFDKLKE